MKRYKWWQDKIVYQIYPKSFYDSNGDGIGDIRGVIAKLPYLRDLGVDIIWICPIYQSPMADNGYDISDYYSVNPEFGTDQDLDDLIQQADQHGIKIIMDLVINHSSDEHEWFKRALADPRGEYGDYYIIREGKAGGPPTNWRSLFGGSAWEPIAGTNLYYLHSFAIKQPDLNWENPVVREKLYEMVNWWLDKGIAGFRVDAITFIKKDLRFISLSPDGADGLAAIQKASLNQPGIEHFLGELRDRTFKVHDCLTVAEAPGVPFEELHHYGGENGYFSMIFDFTLTDLDLVDPMSGNPWYMQSGWTVPDFKKLLLNLMIETQKIGWNPNYLENHDQPRSLNHFLPEADIGYESATMLATLFMLLRGTPFIYQGQEIGMTNCHMDSVDEYDDLSTHDQYARARAANMTHEEAMAVIFYRSRDHARTPFQWSKAPQAGFTTGKPWLKVNPNYQQINLAAEMNDDHSVFTYYRQLIQLRKTSAYKDTLSYGDFAVWPVSSDHVIAYLRVLEGQSRVLVLNNFSSTGHSAEVDPAFTNVLLNNCAAVQMADGRVQLLPYQSIVLAE
jgi:glycosidase